MLPPEPAEPAYRRRRDRRTPALLSHVVTARRVESCRYILNLFGAAERCVRSGGSMALVGVSRPSRGDVGGPGEPD